MYMLFFCIDSQVLTKIYKNSDEFKSDFSLNEMRFAFTLWIKESREQGYRRHDEIQYISQVSTQDQHVKLKIIFFNSKYVFIFLCCR
jgi:hypothetical protein